MNEAACAADGLGSAGAPTGGGSAPGSEGGASAPPLSREALIGRQFETYRIVSLLGAGGMIPGSGLNT